MPQRAARLGARVPVASRPGKTCAGLRWVREAVPATERERRRSRRGRCRLPAHRLFRRRLDAMLAAVAINAESGGDLVVAETGPFDRITFEPGKMGGRACIRGMRITVGPIVGLVAEGDTTEPILAADPDLEPEDILQARAYNGLVDGDPLWSASPARSPTRPPPAPPRPSFDMMRAAMEVFR